MYPQKEVIFYDKFPSLIEILPNYIKKFMPKLMKDPNYLVLADLQTSNSPGK